MESILKSNQRIFVFTQFPFLHQVILKSDSLKFIYNLYLLQFFKIECFSFCIKVISNQKLYTYFHIDLALHSLLLLSEVR